MSEWISVKDRLPEYCAHVLVYYSGNDELGGERANETNFTSIPSKK